MYIYIYIRDRLNCKSDEESKPCTSVLFSLNN